MECGAQIQETTNKRGTWSYYSVDGWYLSTSSEHSRTHKCYIKDTRSEHLSDTVQLQHKSITNPPISHADKIMATIVDCTDTLKNMGAQVIPAQLSQLNYLVGLSEKAAKQDPSVFAKSISTDTSPLPRVPSKNVDQAQRRWTRSMTDQTQSVLRVSVLPKPSKLSSNNPPVVRPAVRRNKEKKKAPPVSVDAPARNTRSRARATSRRLAPPAASTRVCTGTSTRSSRLRQASTAQKAKARAGNAAAVEVRLSRRQLKHMTKQVRHL